MGPICPSWVLDTLSLGLPQAGSSTYSITKDPNLTDPKDPGKDPRFRKLVEAILFSRRFVLTYSLVLLCILTVFTIWHWTEKVVLAKRRRERLRQAKSKDRSVEENVETWSSSSSTVEGTVTPPDAAKKHAANETSPLLGQATTHQTPGYYKPYYLLRYWLQYQPPAVPVINKTLPTNAVSLLVITFLALNVFYNLYRIPFEVQYVFVFADRCGSLFVANLPLLYLLSAKNQPIKFLTGYSYESLNIFHRRVGELLCFEALLHFLGMIVVWYGLLRRLGFTLANFLFNRVVGLGIGAFLAYEILYLTSLGSFRQRAYEVFLALHVFLQTAGLALIFFHHPTSRPYVGIALAIFIIDRLVFRLWLKSSTHPATLAVLEDDETVLLSSNWEVLEGGTALVPENMKKGWKPNDHIFLTIPSLSNKHIFQSHPFTIFSAAPSADVTTDAQHAWFSLLIRAQQDSGFTHTLLAYARSHPTTRIRLDGPYGSSHALDILEDSESAIVVAGGSGIAVAYPLLWALLSPDLSTDPEPGKSSRVKRTVRLLWIVHSASHASWIPEDKMKELRDWGLHVVVPQPTSEVGRPKVQSILKSWVDGRRTGVVVSGPEALVRDVRNTCAVLIGEGEDVRVQVEKFGW
jgi:NAD(P)H-flavin reductase